MKCRGQKILKKPFDIQIGFKNAEGPIFLGTMKELTNSFENAGSGRKEYGAQRSVPNNDDTINQAQGDMQQKLQ